MFDFQRAPGQRFPFRHRVRTAVQNLEVRVFRQRISIPQAHEIQINSYRRQLANGTAVPPAAAT